MAELQTPDKSVSTNIKLTKKAFWDIRQYRPDYNGASGLLGYQENDFIPLHWLTICGGIDDDSKQGIYLCLDNTFPAINNAASWKYIGGAGDMANYFTKDEINGLLAALETSLIGGAPTAGNTLGKLYNLVLGLPIQANVDNISQRNALDAKVNQQVFVSDDGDGKWALYKANTAGVNASYTKLMDQDLFGAVMSNAQVLAALLANPDTHVLTDALLAKLTGIAANATVNDTDTNLKNRANHTGTQPVSSISFDALKDPTNEKILTIETDGSPTTSYGVNAEGVNIQQAVIDAITEAEDEDRFDPVTGIAPIYPIGANLLAGSWVDGGEFKYFAFTDNSVWKIKAVQ